MFDFEGFLKSQIVLASEDINREIEEKALEYFDVGDKKNIINEYLKFNKLTQQHIDVYNNFIKKASNIICSKVIDIGDGRKIYFEDLKFEKPMYQYENTRRKLFPMHARRAHKNYESEWSVQVVIKQNNKEVFRSPDHMCIARIPVMLFSMLCHLENMTDEELIEIGEDPLEYGGYFIVGGTELIILLEEKLSTNRMFIMNSTGDIKDYNTTLKITTDTLKGTRLDELIFNTSNVMKYSIQYLKKANDDKKKSNYKRTKKINVIYVFQLLSEFYLDGEFCSSIDEITDLIRKFVTNPKSMDALLETIAATRSKNNPFTAKEVLSKKIKGNLSIDVQTEDIMAILKNVLEHLEDLSPLDGESLQAYTKRIVKLKVNQLAIMVASYADYLAGFRELDDRDHWANKRVEGPGRKKAQLLRNSLNKTVADISKLLDKTMSNEQLYKIINDGTICKNISKYFNDSMKNSKWGIKGGKLQNNATQILNRDNMFATWSHINTINVNIQRTDKNKKIRQIPPNQLRKVGYIKSPEGSNCIFIQTPVVRADGRTTSLGELRDGDVVLTIDPVTLQQSPSIIKNHFIKSTEEYGKPVLKIIVENGKEVVCTDDHPFLTQLGWILAKDLTIEKHKIVMYQPIDNTYDGSNCVLMPIQKIEPHPHCMVADFTTESDNHSFIANSFCVHNCGLVKPLAITTRISLDRGIEGDRVILMYITYTEEETVQNQHIFILNGKYIGWVDGSLTRDTLISARRNGNIYYDTSFYIDEKYLYADSSPSRLVSPVLIVDKVSQKLVMDLKNITDISPENMIKEGAMEYISAWEEINCKVATDYKTLHKKTVEITRSKLAYQKAKKLYKDSKGDKNMEQYKEEYLKKRSNYRSLLKSKLYTHCDMSGRTGFGVAADTTPFTHHNEGPRNVYQSGMITQAISVPHINYRQRFDNMMKILESPATPIVKTDMYDILGLTERGIGQNVVIAVAAADNTEEDSILFNQGAIDRGLFRIVKYFTVQGQIKISDPIIKSYYGNPAKHGLPYDKKYKNLNEHGLPIIGSYLDEQDCVIGIIKEKNGIKHDDSIYLNYGEKGIVDDIIYHETDTHEIITVKIRHTRIPSNGDKYAARYSQKGTIRIVDELDMPFVEATGVVPDVMINVTVFPSRKTVSYFYEIITGKAAALSGDTVDATAFEDVDMDKWNDILEKHGYSKKGTERMRDGKTGHAIQTDIYIGVAYIQALKHQPQDKIGVRSQGPICSTTHAAVKGRFKNGGLRLTLSASVMSKIIASQRCSWRHDQSQGTSCLIKLILKL